MDLDQNQSKSISSLASGTVNRQSTLRDTPSTLLENLGKNWIFPGGDIDYIDTTRRKQGWESESRSWRQFKCLDCQTRSQFCLKKPPPPFFFALANISWVFITYNWMILSTPSLLSLLYRSLGSRDPWVPGIPGWESLTKHQGEHRNVFVVSVDLDLYLIQISISNLLIHVYWAPPRYKLLLGSLGS